MGTEANKDLQKESLFTWLTRTNIANSRGQRLIHRKLIDECHPEKDGTELMDMLCGSSLGLANMAFTYKFFCYPKVILFFFSFVAHFLMTMTIVQEFECATLCYAREILPR